MSETLTEKIVWRVIIALLLGLAVYFVGRYTFEKTFTPKKKISYVAYESRNLINIDKNISDKILIKFKDSDQLVRSIFQYTVKIRNDGDLPIKDIWFTISVNPEVTLLDKEEMEHIPKEEFGKITKDFENSKNNRKRLNAELLNPQDELTVGFWGISRNDVKADTPVLYAKQEGLTVLAKDYKEKKTSAPLWDIIPVFISLIVSVVSLFILLKDTELQNRLHRIIGPKFKQKKFIAMFDGIKEEPNLVIKKENYIPKKISCSIYADSSFGEYWRAGIQLRSKKNPDRVLIFHLDNEHNVACYDENGKPHISNYGHVQSDRLMMIRLIKNVSDYQFLVDGRHCGILQVLTSEYNEVTFKAWADGKNYKVIFKDIVVEFDKEGFA